MINFEELVLLVSFVHFFGVNFETESLTIFYHLTAEKKMGKLLEPILVLRVT